MSDYEPPAKSCQRCMKCGEHMSGCTNCNDATDWRQLARDILDDNRGALMARLPEHIREAFTEASDQ